MNITRKERLYMNELSKNLYGTSSKWQKLLEKGEVATLTRKLEDGTEEKYKTIVRQTYEELKATLEELWKEEQETKAKEEAEKKSEDARVELTEQAQELGLGYE